MLTLPPSALLPFILSSSMLTNHSPAASPLVTSQELGSAWLGLADGLLLEALQGGLKCIHLSHLHLALLSSCLAAEKDPPHSSALWGSEVPGWQQGLVSRAGGSRVLAVGSSAADTWADLEFGALARAKGFCFNHCCLSLEVLP